MSNFFSSPWFLDAASEVLFPGSGARRCLVEVDSRRFRVLVLRHGGVAPIKLVDFYEEVDPSDAFSAPALKVASLPAVSLERMAADAEHPEIVAGRCLPAPLIDWRQFSSWGSFTEYAKGNDWRCFHRTARKLRKIDHEFGKPTFSTDLYDHDALETLLLWKSRQLRRTRRFDRFASPRVRHFLHTLLESRCVFLAGLLANNRPIALLLGHKDEDRGRLACWITAYDRSGQNVSPGALLFEWLMQESYESGDKEFGFLVGSEPYKFNYATHQHLVGRVGARPLSVGVEKIARSWLAHRPDARRQQKAQRQVFSVLHSLQAHQTISGFAGQRSRWEDLVVANQRDWPRPRLAAPEACQLVQLVDRAADERTLLDEARIKARKTVRRAGSFLSGQSRRTVRFLPPWTTAVGPPPDPLRLSSGECVRVKSREEILAAQKATGPRGLAYLEQAMSPYEGQTFTVERRVTWFFDERQQRVVHPRNAVLLSGARCHGQQVPEPSGCDRACLLFWDEAWLERAPCPEPTAARTVRTRSPSLHSSAPQWVRVRSREEISELEEREPLFGSGAFLPQVMARFCGQTFQVTGQLVHAYDERRSCTITLPETLYLLDDVYCPGVELTGGGVCDRSCPLYWREAWLEPVEAPPVAARRRRSDR